MWSYATSTTSSGRNGSQDKSFPALHRLCPPGMRCGWPSAADSGALESLKPIGGSFPVASGRRDMKWWLHIFEECLESRAPLREWCIAKALIALAQQIEEDDGRRYLYCQFPDARLGGVQSH